MKKTDVPQDKAILDRWHEIAYAIGDNGHYEMVASAGWDPANVANLQAWEVISEEIARAIRAVRGGEASPLVYHMARFQMDVGLLAAYTGLARWRVKRHLRPKIYKRLRPELRARYAKVFKVAPEALDVVPERPEIPVDLEPCPKEPG